MNPYQRIRIALEIRSTINESFGRLKNREEPDFIAKLVDKLPGELKAILNRHNPSIKYNVASCFIHQKPLAAMEVTPLTKNSEIGDLLIVYKEKNSAGEHYNALLLQAKMQDDIYRPTKIKKEELHQLKLYTEWPRFRYLKAGKLNGTERNIYPKSVSAGAQYLLIGRCKNNLGCSTPSHFLVANNCFSLQLVDFLQFTNGRVFSKKNVLNDEWSKMIWDLLELSSNAVFNRRKAGYHKNPRYTGDQINFFESLSMKTDITSTNDSIAEDEEGAISILLIEGIKENNLE